MIIRTVILSGAAALTLSTACFAQDYSPYGNGPQESTPAEMQQTQQLNQQSLNGTGQGDENAPMDEEAGPPPQQSQYENAPMGEEAGPSPQQSQYQAQDQRYQNRMERYRNQQARYHNQRNRYAQDVRAYDLAQYAWSYPAPFAYRYGEGYGLQPLYLMAEASQQLWQVPVEGPGGRWVGRVRNVEIAPDGRPSRVEIALNRRVSVWVRPGDLRFDPTEGILYTNIDRGQLWTMPGATVASAPLPL